MTEITLAPAVIGAISSVVAELLKYIPFLNKNTITKSLTVIVVIIVAIFITQGKGIVTDWHTAAVLFVQAVVYALVSYKMFVQPVAKGAELKTQ